MTGSEELGEKAAQDSKVAEFSDDTVFLNLFFSYEPEKGRFNDLVSASRTIFANQELWQTIQEGLFSVLKSNAAVILYQLGMHYGLGVGSKARELRQSIDEAIKFLQIYGFLAGWGKFKASPILLVEGKLAKNVVITIEDNFFATAGNKETRGSRCFLIAGMLAGIAEALLGEAHTCIETMCMADGANYCEFELTARR